jgi:hypothetical protein
MIDASAITSMDREKCFMTFPNLINNVAKAVFPFSLREKVARSAG